MNRQALTAIERVLDGMDLALKKNDVDAWVQTDEHFHRMLFALCGNARLAAMAEALWEQGHRARMTTVHLRASLERSNREHRAVVGAIQTSCLT